MVMHTPERTALRIYMALLAALGAAIILTSIGCVSPRVEHTSAQCLPADTPVAAALLAPSCNPATR